MSMVNPVLKLRIKHGYFDLSPIDLGENARRDMTLVLRGYGI